MPYIRKMLRKLQPKCVICGQRTHYKKRYGWKCNNVKCQRYEQDLEALNIAIEALKNQETEKE